MGSFWSCTEWLSASPPVSQPFLKCHCIAFLESEIGWKERHGKDGENAQKQCQKTILSTWHFFKTDFIPLRNLELKLMPKLPSLTFRHRWREGYGQKPASIYKLSDRKSWELLTSCDSSHGGADVRRMVTAQDHMPSLICVLSAPDPGFKWIWLSHYGTVLGNVTCSNFKRSIVCIGDQEERNTSKFDNKGKDVLTPNLWQLIEFHIKPGSTQFFFIFTNGSSCLYECEQQFMWAI